MNIRKLLPLPAVALAAAGICTSTIAQPSANVHVWVTGLEAPRGLAFGPEGALYVAEAGNGGTISTVGQCEQVPMPVGPYLGGATARISKIDSSGNRTTVAAGFPSSVDAIGDLEGVADVKFLNGTLYALIAGGGCSHGVAGMPNGIAAVNLHTGKWNYIDNLSTFIQSHPVAYPNPGDFEPDGVFYSMVAAHGRLFTVEPNHGQVISVEPDGDTRNVLDVSASEGHIVPTGITYHDGQFYLGNLFTFPIQPQASRILTLSYADCAEVAAPGLDTSIGHQSLHIVDSKAGFTSVVSTAFGPDGRLYVLELSDAAGLPTANAGKVVRVNFNGSIEDIATGLTGPAGMTFGPDGKLYVSNFGAAPSGAGQIVWIDIP